MNIEDCFLVVVDALEELAIPYMIVGSFSSSYYGIPRSTQDADFVIELGSTIDRRTSETTLPSIRVDPQMSFRDRDDDEALRRRRGGYTVQGGIFPSGQPSARSRAVSASPDRSTCGIDKFGYRPSRT